MVRCFLCIKVPEELREKIMQIQKQFNEFNIKFVEKENLHITLAFLMKGGEREVSEFDIEGIKKAMNGIETKPFEILIKNLIPIPSQSFIRVLAFDIVKGKQEIENIQNHFKINLKKISINPSINPAHLTIGRVKFVKNKEKLVKKIKEQNKEIGSFVCNKITLMQSKLTPQGPVYSEIFSKNLE